jgi:hypothetical protein
MKLPSDLLKLPLKIDAERLAYEVGQIPHSAWSTNPSGLYGNSGLVLVSVNGEINDDFAISGPMQATKHLLTCPYMQQIFAALKAPISRSRLMMLAPSASANTHLDARYHWFRRIRIHIPVVTNPEAFFTCNGETVHMEAGEVWTFNSAKPHAAENFSDKGRIHLVIDTKGSPELDELLQNAKHLPEQFIPYDPDMQASLEIEPYFFEVLTPDEITMMFDHVYQYVRNQLTLRQAEALLTSASMIKQGWQEAFAQYGHSVSGKATYQQLIEQFVAEIKQPIDHLIPKHDMSRFYLEVISGMFTMTNRVCY